MSTLIFLVFPDIHRWADLHDGRYKIAGFHTKCFQGFHHGAGAGRAGTSGNSRQDRCRCDRYAFQFNCCSRIAKGQRD